MITLDRMYCTMIANNADVSIVLPVIHIEKKEMDNVVFKRTLFVYVDYIIFLLSI